MAKLYLITGFLGAGKTTFLHQFVHLFPGKRKALVINEFGKQGVDGTLLSDLGIQEEFEAIFGVLGSYSPILVMIVVAIVLTLMVAPFSGTATTTAMGAMCYAALRSIGLAPVTCCVVFLFLISNEGCTPPQAAPIYIASGIAGLEDPAKIFKNLLFHYALPVIIISMLIMLRVIPIIGA